MALKDSHEVSSEQVLIWVQEVEVQKAGLENLGDTKDLT